LSRTLAFTRLASLAAVVACGASLAQEIFPADPIAGEQVVFTQVLCRPSMPTWLESSSATLGPGTLNFVLDFDGGDFSVGSCARGSVVSPPLPAGTLLVRFSSGEELPVEPSVLRTLQVPATSPASPRYTGLSGNYFDPASSGTGVNLIQGESGMLFAAWFTYAPANDAEPSAPLWLVMPSGKWLAPDRFRGLLYVTTGSPMNRAWSTNDLDVTPAGVLTLTFDTSRQVRFEAVALHPGFPTFSSSSTLNRFAF